MYTLKNHTAMNPKTILDNVVAFISGLYGGGVMYTLQIALRDEVLKIGIAGLTALVCGAMGVAGKYLFVWGWKKLKSIFKK